MPPLAEFFGELERLLGRLYPYRLPLGLAALLALGLLGWLASRRGWHTATAHWVAGHRVASAAAGVLLLAVAIPLGNYTLSPLWERERLSEPSPLEAATGLASIPPGQAGPSAPPAPGGAPLDTPRVLREGTLQGADAFHFGRGRVLLIELPGGSRVLRFEGVSLRNGPDLFVYLSPTATEVGAAVNLGGLKATDGDFNYELPSTIDARALADLDHAVVWCRQFGVLFASAALEVQP